MKVTRKSFGFPINKTITITLDSLLHSAKKEYKDVNLKYIIECTEEEKKSIKEKELVEKLLSETKANSIKITYQVQKETHIRSEKIIKAKTNTEKLEEWCRVNKIKLSESLLMKEKLLEESQTIKYIKPHHSFQLLKVKLRGAIGIKEGTGKEELEVDFSQYQEGIIALCGFNGKGKTTLIENCHPYPKMLTRNGKLQSHFYLKDSYRNLLYIDEEEIYYDITIMIDGKTQSGKCKYFVKTGKDVKDLKPIDSIDGNLDPYIEWVNNTFGTIDLFLRTAFFAKETTGDIPDISKATKGEKKTLFSSLIGIDYLSNLSEAAKIQKKELEKEVDKTEAKIIPLTDNLSEEKLKDEINCISENIDNTEVKINELQISISEKEKVLSQLENSNKDDIKNEIKTVKQTINGLEEVRETLEEYKTNVSLYETFSKEKLEYEVKLKEYNDFLENSFNPICSVETEKKELVNKANFEVTKLYGEYQLALSKVTAIKTNCPYCNQPLPPDELKNLKEQSEVYKKESDVMYTLYKKANNELENAKKELKEINLTDIQNKKVELEDELSNLTGWQTYDFERFAELKTLCRKYENADIEKDIEVNQLKLQNLKALQDSFDNSEYIKLSKEIKELKENLSENEDEKSELYIELGKTSQALENLRQTIKTNKELALQIKELNKDISDYETLEKAFGSNGIQALELEALSPEISDLTNEILSSAYGDRFRISFQTLREGADHHLIEDFSILVEDTHTGTKRPLEWLSSGEAVWVKEALYNAFSITRMKSTEFCLKTRFLDECDGSLDSDARIKYLNMIKTAHQEGGAIHTILITHSQELKDVIENKIEW